MAPSVSTKLKQKIIITADDLGRTISLVRLKRPAFNIDKNQRCCSSTEHKHSTKPIPIIFTLLL